MSDEFVNRYRRQREVVYIVNSSMTLEEELCGLSASAIDRWKATNNVSDEHVVETLREIASLLFFLSTKSQDPVSDRYRERLGKLDLAIEELRRAV